MRVSFSWLGEPENNTERSHPPGNGLWGRDRERNEEGSLTYHTCCNILFSGESGEAMDARERGD